MNAAWEQMNRGMSVKKLPLSFSSKPPSNRNKTQPENSYVRMPFLLLIVNCDSCRKVLLGFLVEINRNSYFCSVLTLIELDGSFGSVT